MCYSYFGRLKTVWSKSPKVFDFSLEESHRLPSQYIELATVTNTLIPNMFYI